MNKGAWQATVHGVAKESDTIVTKQQQTTVMVYWERRCLHSLSLNSHVDPMWEVSYLHFTDRKLRLREIL